MSAIGSARARERSASEPFSEPFSEPSLQVVSGNFTRERARKTDLNFELGKDKLAHWIGAWKYDEVRVCSNAFSPPCMFVNQMEFKVECIF